MSGFTRASSLSLEQLRPLLSAGGRAHSTTHTHTDTHTSQTRPREIIPLGESYVPGRKSRETDSQRGTPCPSFPFSRHDIRNWNRGINVSQLGDPTVEHPGRSVLRRRIFKEFPATLPTFLSAARSICSRAAESDCSPPSFHPPFPASVRFQKIFIRS